MSSPISRLTWLFPQICGGSIACKAALHSASGISPKGQRARSDCEKGIELAITLSQDLLEKLNGEGALVFRTTGPGIVPTWNLLEHNVINQISGSGAPPPIGTSSSAQGQPQGLQEPYVPRVGAVIVLLASVGIVIIPRTDPIRERALCGSRIPFAGQWMPSRGSSAFINLRYPASSSFSFGRSQL